MKYLFSFIILLMLAIPVLSNDDDKVKRVLKESTDKILQENKKLKNDIEELRKNIKMPVVENDYLWYWDYQKQGWYGYQLNARYFQQPQPILQFQGNFSIPRFNVGRSC